MADRKSTTTDENRPASPIPLGELIFYTIHRLGKAEGALDAVAFMMWEEGVDLSPERTTQVRCIIDLVREELARLATDIDEAATRSRLSDAAHGATAEA